MNDADAYRHINSWNDDEGDPVQPMTVTVWDVLIIVMTGISQTLMGLANLAKGHNNRLVERKAVELEMRAGIEAIAR